MARSGSQHNEAITRTLRIPLGSSSEEGPQDFAWTAQGSRFGVITRHLRKRRPRNYTVALLATTFLPPSLSSLVSASRLCSPPLNRKLVGPAGYRSSV